MKALIAYELQIAIDTLLSNIAFFKCSPSIFPF